MPGLYPGFYPGSTSFPGVVYPDPDPSWWIGPLGRLRRLPVPDTEIDLSTIRYGGIHQGLSGARTVDVTGYKAEYKFKFSYMTQEEWRFLELLHHRHIQGPYYLINPLKTNRLSTRAVSGRQMDPVGSIKGGVSSNAFLTPVRDGDYPPSPAGPLVATELKEYSTSPGYILFDRDQPYPILPGEYISMGVWLRATTTPFEAQIRVDWYDKVGQQITAAGTAMYPVGTSWTFVSFDGAQVPAGVAGATFGVMLPDSIPGNNIRFSGPQVNGGLVLKPFSEGHAGPEVVIDQLTTTSPRFPLRSGELTVLEA